ncbi:MAG TPA: hypothetical protein VJR89_38740 [Polyangiales bacterium]|nr:hypothetical protein [Polyangiales bacterium]
MARVHITLHSFTATFVPFALLLSAALLAAETTDSLEQHRLVYTIWVSLALSGPALALYVLPQHRDRDYTRLLWTFAYLAYLGHFYYAFGKHYHFSARELYAGQGALIATGNLLLTAAWSVDVVLSWCFQAVPRWLRIEQVATRIFYMVEVVASALVLFHGFVRVIGAFVTALVAISCLAYWLTRPRRAQPLQPALDFERGTTP